MYLHFNGLMQKRCQSSALAVELHLFCIKISISYHSATHRSGTGNGNLSSWKTIIHLYYSCRCSGDAKSQDISKHGLDLLSPQYYEPCTVWVKKLRNSHSHICKIRYHPTFINIRCTKSQNLNVVGNEDIVGAAARGASPNTSEWSTILLPTKVWLMY